MPTIGVPQGSHIGPLLFILYVNAVGNSMKFANYLMYADDLKMFAQVGNAVEELAFQEDINRVEAFFQDLGMTINAGKTKFMRIRPRTRDCYQPQPYALSTGLIEEVSHFRDLGVIFDCFLGFERHLSDVVSRARRLLGFAYRTRKSVGGKDVYKTIYSSYVLPIVEYCGLVWFNRSVGMRDTIERIQRTFTRMILGIPADPRAAIYIGYDERLKRLNMDSLGKRRDIARIAFGSKVARGIINSRFLKAQLVEAPQLRVTRHHRPYVVAANRSLLYHRRPMIAVAEAMNYYSDKIDLTKSILTIKNAMKKRFAERRDAEVPMEGEQAVL